MTSYGVVVFSLDLRKKTAIGVNPLGLIGEVLVTSLTELMYRYERLLVQLSEQRYDQKAGLPFDKELMKQLSEQMTEVCSEFLRDYSEPRSMYLESIANIASAKRLEVELEFEEARMAKISTDKYDVSGRKLNWGSWRQFNSITEDPNKRKEIFDLFISKAPSITPLVEKRMAVSQNVYAEYDMSPLDSYLELEQMTFDELRGLLMQLDDGAKDSFLKAAEHYAPEVLGKNKVEYFDDYYTWGGRIFRPLSKYFKGISPLEKVRDFLTQLGFDTANIKVDDEDREKKSPSAFCFGIQIPNDVRVVYRKVSPFSDFGSVFHEFGHGIHGISANPEDPVWKRYIVSRSVAETFSTLNESMLDAEEYLEEDLGLEKEAVVDILDRRRFIDLAFLTFYAANGVMKMEFWKNRYSAEQAARRWQELTKRFFVEVPGYYWVLHHIMPNYDMYSPSYVIAAIRVNAIEKRLVEEFGERWWRNRKAGAFVKELAVARGEFKVKAWPLNPSDYLEDVKDLSFL